MLGWHSLALGDAVTAHVSIARITAAFDAACAGSGPPKGAAVFARYESEGRLHCEVTVFFSPAASELARRFGAHPSAAPLRDGLELLCGAEPAE
jgi:hypothetical protein